MSQEKVAETFDRWVDEGQDTSMEEGHGDVVRQALERMEIGAGERVLDLGCGNGWATRLIARSAAGVQAIGVDASPKMIARADELHSFTIRARYDFASFEALDFGDAEFDRVFSMEAMYYAGDLDRAIAEAFRVLKPGGRAEILVNYFEENPASETWPADIGLDMHRLDADGWRAAFEKAGFADVSTEILRGSSGSDGATLWVRAVKPA